MQVLSELNFKVQDPQFVPAIDFTSSLSVQSTFNPGWCCFFRFRVQGALTIYQSAGKFSDFLVKKKYLYDQWLFLLRNQILSQLIWPAVKWQNRNLFVSCKWSDFLLLSNSFLSSVYLTSWRAAQSSGWTPYRWLLFLEEVPRVSMGGCEAPWL